MGTRVLYRILGYNIILQSERIYNIQIISIGTRNLSLSRISNKTSGAAFEDSE